MNFKKIEMKNTSNKFSKLMHVIGMFQKHQGIEFSWMYNLTLTANIDQMTIRKETCYFQLMTEMFS